MFSSKWQLGLLALVLSLLPASTASADGINCGYNLVVSGDSLYKVRSVCGKPDAAVRRVERRYTGQSVLGYCTQIKGKVRCRRGPGFIDVVIDEWTYDFGEYRFIQTLTFEQGVLMRVEAGTYGRKKHR